MTIPESRNPRCARIRLLRIGFALTILSGISTSLSPSCLALPQSNHPEKAYALIYGTVFGPNDLTVYGVRVHIRRSDQKKPKWELYSDHAGEFAQRVPPGPAKYVIWADLKGFKPLNGKKLEAGEAVTVEIQNDERADVSLHLK